jgi:hypothetical protein
MKNSLEKSDIMPQMNDKFSVKILLEQLQEAHKNLEATMEGVTSEIAHFQPEGKANPIAGVYAHVVFTEDLFVQALLKKASPLYDTDWKDNTGASEIQPTDWAEAYPKWLRQVKLDLEQFQSYAKAVYENSEKYIESLTDADLNKGVDMSAFGMGERKAYDFIGNIIISHIHQIMGEISVLKGVQGLKGFPF